MTDEREQVEFFESYLSELLADKKSVSAFPDGLRFHNVCDSIRDACFNDVETIVIALRYYLKHTGEENE